MKRWHGFLNIPEGSIRTCNNGDSTTVAVKRHTFPRGHQFYLSTMRGALIGGQKMKPIAFDRETEWHFLTENEGIWMSDLPVEQAQADALMRGIAGTVLVGGLGLGYVAQRLALRKSIERVVVVEINPAVIQLVLRHLRGRDKIEIVLGNIHEYVATTEDKFDWCYFDTWAPDGERVLFETVIPLRRAGERVLHRPTQWRIRCWNEDVMRGQLTLGLVSRVTFGVESDAMDVLAIERDDPWHDWSVPFFRFAIRAGNKTNLVDEARFYANIYGAPKWETLWQQYTEARLR